MRGSGMHLDFVLADAVTLGPALVIELDDKTHWRADARERDAFKDTALPRRECRCFACGRLAVMTFANCGIGGAIGDIAGVSAERGAGFREDVETVMDCLRERVVGRGR